MALCDIERGIQAITCPKATRHWRIRDNASTNTFSRIRARNAVSDVGSPLCSGRADV